LNYKRFQHAERLKTMSCFTVFITHLSSIYSISTFQRIWILNNILLCFISTATIIQILCDNISPKVLTSIMVDIMICNYVFHNYACHIIYVIYYIMVEEWKKKGLVYYIILYIMYTRLIRGCANAIHDRGIYGPPS